MVMLMECIKVADLNIEHFKAYDVCRRVYSPDGISPTITAGGGTQTVKIIVSEVGKDED